MSSKVVQLHKIDLSSDRGRAFVLDATRAGEGLITDAELQEIYELTPADWIAITKDANLGRAVRDERTRRVRNGTAAQESAARFFVKGPAILDQIANDVQSNARHKIDAIRELRATATGSGDGDGPSQGEKFSIVINLGSDCIERHEVDITPKPRVNLEQEDNGNWG